MKRTFIFLLVVAVVVGLYFICVSYIPEIVGFFGRQAADQNHILESYGLFGDSTGAINTLFSALAFAMVIFTLYLQSVNNSKQERENNIVHFEENFFSMTSMLEQIVSNLSCISVASDPFKPLSAPTAEAEDLQQGESSILDSPLDDILSNNGGKELEGKNSHDHSLEIKGRQVFAYYYNYIPIEGTTVVGLREGIRQSGIECYKATTSDGILDHYFRYLYRIIKYVDECKLLTSSEQKRYYICMLRAQLSCYELLMLFYNCQIPDQGRHKFKDYIERYQLFNNLRADLLARSVEKRLYTNKMKPDFREPASIIATEYKQSAFLVVSAPNETMLDKVIKYLSHMKRYNILHRLDVIETKLTEITNRPRRISRS